MKCLNPTRLPQGIFVPCGKCVSCRINRQEEWIFRMEKEMLSSNGSCYAVTFTYDQENVPYEEETGLILDKKHLIDLTKRIRNYVDRQKLPKEYTGKKINFIKGLKMKYYAVGEYGDETGRPHYHILFFNFPVVDPEAAHNLFLFAWENKGFVYIDRLSTKAMRYVCGYIVENKKKLKTAFVNRSKGIGESYLTVNNQKYHVENLQPYAKKLNGTSVKLGKYYRDKMFSIKVKEKIFKKGLEYFNNISDEEAKEKIQSNFNLAESKKRQLITNRKFKTL